MTDAERLAELRGLRDQAWAVLRGDVDALKQGLEERGIGERIKDRAVDEAQEAWVHAVDVASENKGVVAATILALLAWLLRGPLGSAFDAFFGGRGEPDSEAAIEGGEGDLG